MTEAMTRKVIRADGTEEPFDPAHKGRGLSGHIRQVIGAPQGCDVVQLRHLGQPMWVMVCDDTGFIDSRPVNAKATDLYHANCHPGTTHPICGDVVVLMDDDFAY